VDRSSPAAMMSPPGVTATAWAWPPPGKLVVTPPPVPNVVSGVPLALSRSTPKLVGVVFSYPAMMICPAGVTATALAASWPVAAVEPS
jgi:hypothetical protein